jgi:tetratricopeptide (TPR) repeat protein
MEPDGAQSPPAEVQERWQAGADGAIEHERQHQTKESARALLGKARANMPSRAAASISVLHPAVTDPILQATWFPQATAPASVMNEAAVEHERSISLFHEMDKRNRGVVSSVDIARVLQDLGMPQTDRQLEAVLDEIRGDQLPQGADIPFPLFKLWYDRQLNDKKEEEKLAARGTLKNFWLPPVSRHHLKTPTVKNRGALRPGTRGHASPRSHRVAAAVAAASSPKKSRHAEYHKREMADIKEAIKNGQTAAAVRKLNNIIEQYPRAASLRTMRSMVLLREGNARQSEVKQLEAGVRRLRAREGFGEAEHKSEVRELLADVKEANDASRDCWTDALTDAKRAIDVSPKEFKAYYWAGMAAGKLGRPDEAMIYIQKCLEHNPGDKRYRAAFDEFFPESQRSRPYRAHGECAYVPVVSLCPTEGAGGPTNRVPSVRPFIPKPGERVEEARPLLKKKPPQRKHMDDSWKRIDLSDITFELTIIHECIVGALADGEVDDDEAYLIDTKLKSAEIPTKLRKQIKEGLDGDDNPETLDMLRSICPPGFHRGCHGPENVYSQPLVCSVLKAALIGCKSPWQPDPPGYVDEATLCDLGVPARTRRMLVNAMMCQDGTMAPEGKVLRMEDDMLLCHLCSKLPADHALEAAEKFDQACGLMSDALLEAEEPDVFAIVSEILQHRSEAIAKGLKYENPSESEYEEPLFEPMACGCSITSCTQCIITDCDDWDKILADLDENHGVYKTLFRLYGLASDGRAEMNKTTFQDFCIRCDITDESDAKTR